MRAVGGLSQVCGHELVSIDLVDSPSHSPLALPGEMFEDSVSLQSGYTTKERKKERAMKLAVSNVRESLTAQILSKLFLLSSRCKTPQNITMLASDLRALRVYGLDLSEL